MALVCARPDAARLLQLRHPSSEETPQLWRRCHAAVSRVAVAPRSISTRCRRRKARRRRRSSQAGYWRCSSYGWRAGPVADFADNGGGAVVDLRDLLELRAFADVAQQRSLCLSVDARLTAVRLLEHALFLPQTAASLPAPSSPALVGVVAALQRRVPWAARAEAEVVVGAWCRVLAARVNVRFEVV